MRAIGPLNKCSNGDCHDLVEILAPFQYCEVCRRGSLGIVSAPRTITRALQRRRRLLLRVLWNHKRKPPPWIVKHVLDHLINDLGAIKPSMRWACLLSRYGLLDRGARCVSAGDLGVLMQSSDCDSLN